MLNCRILSLMLLFRGQPETFGFMGAVKMIFCFLRWNLLKETSIFFPLMLDHCAALLVPLSLIDVALADRALNRL